MNLLLWMWRECRKDGKTNTTQNVIEYGTLFGKPPTCEQSEPNTFYHLKDAYDSRSCFALHTLRDCTVPHP